MGLGKLVQKLIFSLGFTAAVAFGCNDSKPPVKPVPLVEAVCSAVTDDSGFHVLEKPGKILSFSDNKANLVIENNADFDYELVASVGNNQIIVHEKDKNDINSSDLTLFDLESLTKVLDTDSTGYKEEFFCFIENGKKFLMTEYRQLTSATRLFIVDPDTKTIENLFPSPYTSAKIFTDKNAKIQLLGGGRGASYHFYSFDTETGEKKTIIDNRWLGIDVYSFFTSEVIAGKDSDNVFFVFDNGNSAKAFYRTDPDFYPNIIDLSPDSRKGLIKEVRGDKKITKLYCFDIYSGTYVEIDFTSFIGWDGNDVPHEKVLMNSDKIIIEGKSINPLLANILAYNINSNSVEDIINVFYQNLDTEDEELIKKYKNTALIKLKAETSPGTNKINQILLYDGNTLVNPFSTYSGNINILLDNDKYLLITAENSLGTTDLLIYNIENNSFEVLENNYSTSKEHIFSINEKMLAYITEVNNKDSLNIYNIENNILRKDVKQDTEITPKFFNRNNTNLIYKKRTLTTDLFEVIDRNINTGKEKKICKEN
jgi:hypothetical protein